MSEYIWGWGYPIISHRFCGNPSRGFGGKWGFKLPNTPWPRKWGGNGVVWGHSRSSAMHYSNSIERVRFPINLPWYNYVPVLHRFLDTARYWSKIAYFTHPPLFGDLVGVPPFEFGQYLRHQESRVAGYSVALFA